MSRNDIPVKHRLSAWRVLAKVASIGCLLGLSAVRAEAATSANAFYDSLASAVDSAQARAVFYLREGRFKTPVQGGALFWMVGPNTRATVMASYRGGALQTGASIAFNNPVRVWFGGLSQEFVHGATYGDTGDVDTIQAEFVDPQHDANPNATIKLKDMLALPHGPQRMMTTSPFNFIGQAQECNPTFTQCTDNRHLLFYRVRVLSKDDNVPGFRMSLRPGATINLADPGAPPAAANTVTIGGDSSVNFDEVDYNLDDKTIVGRLDTLNLTVTNGRIHGGSAGILLKQSKLTASSVTFGRSPTGAFVNATDGILAGIAGGGTTFGMGRTIASDPLFLTIAEPGAAVTLAGFSLTINDQGGPTVTFGGGSSISGAIGTTRLPLNAGGFIGLNSGSLDVAIGGTWAPSNVTIDGLVNAVSGQVDSGRFSPNAESVFKFVGGSFSANQLKVHGDSAGASILGTIASANIVIDAGSKYALPNGFLFVENGAGTLAIDPNSPLQFSTLPYPTGRITAAFNFSLFKDRADQTFALRDGTIQFGAARGGDGQTVLDGLRGNGTFVFKTPLGANPILVAASVKPNVDGAGTAIPLTWSPRDGISGSLLMSGTVTPNIAYDFTTPYQKGVTEGDGSFHGNEVFFSLLFRLKLTTASTFGDTPVTFDGKGVHTSLSLPLTIGLNVPEGGGEHKDDGNPAKGTKGGDEDWQHGQEVWTDTFGTCRAHIYLLSKTYNVTTNFAAKIDGKTVAVDLTKFDTGESIAWHKDGCDLKVIGAIAGALGGFLVGGPVGAGLSAVAGGIIGSNAEGTIERRVATLVAEKIQNFHLNWSVDIN